jgi:predicted nuclease with TOPRIM domain
MKKRDLEKLVVKFAGECDGLRETLRSLREENSEFDEENTALRSKIYNLEHREKAAEAEVSMLQKRVDDLEKEHSSHADFLFPVKTAQRDRLITQSICKAMELAGVDTLKIPLPARGSSWEPYELTSDFCISSQEWTLKMTCLKSSQ